MNSAGNPRIDPMDVEEQSCIRIFSRTEEELVCSFKEEEICRLSPVFSGMLTNNTRERRKKAIHLDLPAHAILALFDIARNVTVTVPLDARTVWKAADMLLMDSVKEYIERHAISEDNVVIMLALAVEHDSKSLFAQCLPHVRDAMLEGLAADNVGCMSESMVYEVLKAVTKNCGLSQYNYVRAESALHRNKFCFILRWLQCSSSATRASALSMVKEFVSFYCTGKDFVHETVVPSCLLDDEPFSIMVRSMLVDTAVRIHGVHMRDTVASLMANVRKTFPVSAGDGVRLFHQGMELDDEAKCLAVYAVDAGSFVVAVEGESPRKRSRVC